MDARQIGCVSHTGLSFGFEINAKAFQFLISTEALSV